MVAAILVMLRNFWADSLHVKFAVVATCGSMVALMVMMSGGRPARIVRKSEVASSSGLCVCDDNCRLDEYTETMSSIDSSKRQHHTVHLHTWVMLSYSIKADVWLLMNISLEAGCTPHVKQLRHGVLALQVQCQTSLRLIELSVMLNVLKSTSTILCPIQIAICHAFSER